VIVNPLINDDDDQSKNKIINPYNYLSIHNHKIHSTIEYINDKQHINNYILTWYIFFLKLNVI
jgi:hypothetical protein